MSVLREAKQFYDAAEVVILARDLGLEGVTVQTVRQAAYYGNRPLKRTKIANRVYFSRGDIEHWLASCRVPDRQA